MSNPSTNPKLTELLEKGHVTWAIAPMSDPGQKGLHSFTAKFDWYYSGQVAHLVLSTNHRYSVEWLTIQNRFLNPIQLFVWNTSEKNAEEKLYQSLKNIQFNEPILFPEFLYNKKIETLFKGINLTLCQDM